MSDGLAGKGTDTRSRREEPLRKVRHERSTFEPRFFDRHREFWPIARAAATFASHRDWPDVAAYGSAFEGVGPVRFERSPAKRKRPQGEVVVRESLYDAVIVRRRVVPTRAKMWHDYLNALVWATFPRAKLALHGRQHAAIERWIPEGATQLPNARTRELDALALVDEGGVAVLDHGPVQLPVLFGHALFEGLVFARPAMVARAVVLDASAYAPTSGSAAVALVDRLLSAVLDDCTRIVSPDELPRLPL